VQISIGPLNRRHQLPHGLVLRAVRRYGVKPLTITPHVSIELLNPSPGQEVTDVALALPFTCQFVGDRILVVPETLIISPRNGPDRKP
jgi:hypothetical protein